MTQNNVLTMKKIIYIILIVPLLSFSQTYSIEYDVILNFLNRKGTLTINNAANSFYEEIQVEKKLDEKKMDEDRSYSNQIFLGNNNEKKTRYQLYNKIKDTLLNIDYLYDKKIICLEPFQKMNWNISNETKKISNYMCNKASTTFRGRNYIAWFTLQIPINVGPWKFNNLPGAILQVSDESNSFSWTATKIATNQTETDIAIEPHIKKMSLEEFIKENEKSKNEMANQMILKYVERGAKILKTETTEGRELKFEWEE